MTKRKTLPKYVSCYPTRHNKPKYRFRTTKPPVDYTFKSHVPYSDEFMKEYYACLDGTPPNKSEVGSSKTVPGSFDQLIAMYYGSPEFVNLSDATKATYRGIIERFRNDYGKYQVRGMKKPHVKKILEKKSKTPAAANNLLRMIRMLISHAIDAGMRDDDPTYGIRTIKIKSSGFPAWTDDEVAQFEEAHPIGSRARLALALLLYTGQRRSDVIRCGWPAVSRDNTLRVTQQKTKTKLEIPIHPELKRVLQETPKDNITFLVTSFGQPFTAAGFGNWFKKMCLEAGIEDKSAHGLRKTAARRLAEAGCTSHQIMSITGHQSIKEVDHYTRSADQKKLASAAIVKLQQKGQNV